MSTEVERLNPSALKGLSKNDEVILFTVTPEEYNDFRVRLVKHVSVNQGVYITLTTPHTVIEDKVGASKLFYIDGVSSADKKCVKSCEHIDALNSLTDLSIGLTKVFDKGIYNHIILDSVNTMIMYHKTGLTEQFLNYLVNKARYYNLKLFLINVGEKISPELNNVCTFVDKCVTA